MGTLTTNEIFKKLPDVRTYVVTHQKIIKDIGKETYSLEELAEKMGLTKEGVRYIIDKNFKDYVIRVPLHKHNPYRIPKTLGNLLIKNR